MVKNHLSRLDAPTSWPIQRKGIKFVTRPSPGSHTLRTSIPLSLVLTKTLKYARINKEVRKILHEGKVLVNNKHVRRDKAYAVGLMDIISVPSLKESFRIVFDEKGKFTAVKLEDEESYDKLVKIANKTQIKGGKTQLNNADGTTLLVEKDSYKTGDTLVISLQDKKVKEHLAFEKGAKIYLTGGKNVGKVGTLEEVRDHHIVVKSGGDMFETALRHAFVVGDHKTA